MKNCKGIFVGFALLIAISSCGERDVEGELRDHIAENARYDVNQFVLEKLEQNRIVMLADAGHGVRLYLQSVIGILNHWLDTNIARAGSGDPICRNVILVLELDSLWVEAVEEYGESNDPDDVLYIGHLATEIFTTAKLEFYLDLGDLRRRIDEYNQSCSQDQPLNLSLFGPEKPIDMDNWSAEKREQFFVYERDEYSSQRLTAHLEQHPESRALVFYGNAHLNRGRVTKTDGDVKAEGYYIAHYLTETFGDNGGVYVLEQMRAGVGGGRYAPTFAAPRVNYGLDNTIFPFEHRTEDPEVRANDGWLIWFEQNAPSMPIYRIYSEALLKFVVENMDDIADTTNEFYRTYWWAIGAYLEIIPDTSSAKPYRLNSPRQEETIKDWQRWADTADVGYVTSIESLGIWDRMVDRLAEADSSDARYYINRLNYSLGRHEFPEWGDDLPSPTEVAEHYREHLRIWRKEIVIERLVHMLWVCSDEERKEAIAVLTKETGQEFLTAKEWMVWWSEEGYRSL